jgi:hypothetical protein
VKASRSLPASSEGSEHAMPRALGCPHRSIVARFCYSNNCQIALNLRIVQMSFRSLRIQSEEAEIQRDTL